MKLNQEQRQFSTDVADSQVKGFHIKQSAHMFRTLSSGIYSDKPLAVIRELSSNAWDAHIAAGNVDKPFNIHLPNDNEPYFSIRDFGIGLSEEDVYSLYCTYGGTNKDQSNDFVGGFGLGSKSPFAYNDQFTITSFFGGMKTIYNAFVNADGTPQVMKTSQTPTDEPVGLEIKVPVKKQDFSSFKERARKIFKRYPVLPMIDGVAEFKPEVVKYLLDRDDFKIRDENSQHYSGGWGSCWAVQGLVAYKINTSNMQTTLNRLQDVVLNSNFDLIFPIGDVSITASRDSLEYDKRTEANILAKVDKILEELPKIVQKEISDAGCLWDANLVFNKWYKENYLPTTIKDHVGKNLTYKGVALERGNVKYDFSDKGKETREGLNGQDQEFEVDVPYAEVLTYTKSVFDMKRITAERGYKGSIYAKPDTVFVWDDVQARTINPKVEYHFKDEGRTVVIIQADKKHKRKILKQLGNPPIKNWSEYDEPPKEFKEKSTVQRSVKKLLKFDGSSDLWSNQDVSHDVSQGGFYIITYSRQPQLKNPKNYNFRRFIMAAKELGLIDADVAIYGIQSTFKNIPENYDGWINIEEYIEEEFKKRYPLKSIPKIRANYDELRQVGILNVSSIDALYDANVEFMNSNSLMGRLFKGYNQLLGGSTLREMDDVLNFSKLCYGNELRTVKPDIDLQKLEQMCKVRYPLAWKLGYRANPEELKHYVDVCDKSPSITPKKEQN